MLILLTLMFVSCCLGHAFMKLVRWLFGKQKKPVHTNPYIRAHKLRNENDQLYEDYLSWMDKNNKGLPIDKKKTKEELDFEKQLN